MISSDGIDFLVVSVADATHRGQFVFNRELLIAKGIMSKNGKGGKLAFRIYPPWSKPLAQQAIRTQQWQLQYFLFMAQDGTADSTEVHRLFV